MNTADPIHLLRARVAALGPEQRADFRRQLEARGIAWDRVAPQETERLRPARLPLSPGQMHFWLQQSLYPENSAYHVAYRWRFQGVLDRHALERSLQTIVDRHEPLRTAFPVADGEPWQRVLPHCTFRLDYTDVAGATDRLEEVAQNVATEPFDLATAPLLRAHLVRVDEDDHLLAITLHHIISDGWSRGVLMREITTCYRAYSKGVEPDLQRLPRSFSDLVLDQQAWLQGAQCTRQETYWKKHLAELKPLELPADRSRHTSIDMASATVSRTVSREISASVSALASQLGTTSFIVLAAAFKLLLHRYCGQQDLTICTPVAGRADSEAAQLIGLFTNTLVLRNRLDPGMTFAAWVARVQENFSDALEHQDFPFPMLADTLGMNRDARQNPLSQIMFQLQSGGYRQQNAETVDFGIDGLSVRQQPAPLSETKVDLSWYMMERDSGYLLTIEYRAALFDSWRIERMAQHFEQLLLSIIQAPDAHLPTLPYMAPDERQAVIDLGTPVAKPLPAKTVHEAISDVARHHPDAVALENDGRIWTYRDLERETDLLAFALLSLPDPVRPGDRVAVSLPGRGHSILAFLAILKVGAIYVPLDPDHPADRVAYVLQDAGVGLILTDRPQAYPEHRCIDPAVMVAQAAEPVALPAADQVRVAYLLYTSGSTGRPNGVPIGHASLLNHLRSMAEVPGLKPGDRMLAITTPTFDISILEMLLPLSVGATVILYGQDLLLAPVRLGQVLADDRISHMQATPAYWRMLLDSGWQGCATLTALCGGEALDAPLARRLLERTKILWNVYGPTEATIWASALQVTARHAESGKVPIGGLLDNTHLHVLDPYLEPLPRGIPGELYIGGVCLSPGYWNRPALAAARFLPNPFYDENSPAPRLYKTGDAVVRQDDGEIEFVGRTDFQVKLRGYRIEIGEIEDRLLQDAVVDQAIVMLDEANERLVAYVLVQDPSIVIEDGQMERALRQSLMAQLPRYMVPTAFVLLRAFPLNPSGKVDRKRLPVPQVSFASSVTVAPRNATEDALLTIWKDVLKRDDIGVEDNFFDLGGDSIIGVRIVARAQAAGFGLGPTQIFELQTVAAQAAAVTASDDAPSRSSIWQRHNRNAALDPWLVILPWLASADDAKQAAEIVANHHPALRGRLNDAMSETAADDDAALLQWARTIASDGEAMAFGVRTVQRGGDRVCAIAAHPLLLDAQALTWIASDMKEASERLTAGSTAALHATGDYDGWLANDVPATPSATKSAQPGNPPAIAPRAEVSAFLDAPTMLRLETTARHLAASVETMALATFDQVLAQTAGCETASVDMLTATRPTAAQQRTIGNFTRLLPVPRQEPGFKIVGRGAFLADFGQGLDPAAGRGDVLFCWQEIDGARLEWMSVPNPALPDGYGLVLQATRRAGVLDLRWRYDPARFGHETVERIAAQHLAALTAIKADEGTAAAKVDRLLDKLRQRKG